MGTPRPWMPFKPQIDSAKNVHSILTTVHTSGAERFSRERGEEESGWALAFLSRRISSNVLTRKLAIWSYMKKSSYK